MKAYKDKKGVARLFRPMMNMKRMNDSMARLAMPVRHVKLPVVQARTIFSLPLRWHPSSVTCIH
jgi:branched-chain amino acid aminotransferase